MRSPPAGWTNGIPGDGNAHSAPYSLIPLFLIFAAAKRIASSSESV